MKLFQWLIDLIACRYLEEVPDLSGTQTGMDFWVKQLHTGQNFENPELPRDGDWFHCLHTDSMGAYISRHERFKILGKYKSASGQWMLILENSNNIQSVENAHVIDKMNNYHRNWVRVV